MEGFFADELLRSVVALRQPQSISRSAATCNKQWRGNCGYRHATNNYQRYQESITLIPHVVCLQLSALNNSWFAKNAHTHKHKHSSGVTTACGAWVREKAFTPLYCIILIRPTCLIIGKVFLQHYFLQSANEVEWQLVLTVWRFCQETGQEGKCLPEYSPPGCFDRSFIPPNRVNRANFLCSFWEEQMWMNNDESIHSTSVEQGSEISPSSPFFPLS